MAGSARSRDELGVKSRVDGGATAVLKCGRVVIREVP
jgi:hypothetical protein